MAPLTPGSVREKITEKKGSLFWRNVTVGFKVANVDAPWEYTEEPHVQRRQEILKKYPEVKKLFGYDPMVAVFVSGTVATQLVLAYLVRDAPWPILIPLTWIISGTLNHSLGGAIHEIGHNLAFGHKHPLANRALGMLANIPMAVPLSVTYKKYHSDHHRYLGHDTLDVDIPSVIETKLFRHWTTKLLWLTIHPLIHGVRPFLKNPVPLLLLEVINFFVQITFDIGVLYFLGPRSLFYLLVGTLLSLGLHPLAGHFISEHYLFWKGQATANYYGPLNFFIYNLGYHIEHHDFPYIPFRRLPQLQSIAPEFYNDIPYHTSWCRVLWDFIFRDDMGPHARAVGYLPQGVDEDDMVRLAAKAKAEKHSSSNGVENGGKKIS